MPPNNTYVNFERFSKVLEEITAVEESIQELVRNKKSFKEDIDALVSIYDEKESWYKEENESISQDLGHIKNELRKTETLRKQAQDEVKSTMLSTNILKRKYTKLENRYDALTAELKWVGELLKSVEQEGMQGGIGNNGRHGGMR